MVKWRFISLNRLTDSDKIMQQQKPMQEEDLKPYRTLGIPMVKLLFGVVALVFLLTALYEYLR